MICHLISSYFKLNWVFFGFNHKLLFVSCYNTPPSSKLTSANVFCSIVNFNLQVSRLVELQEYPSDTWRFSHEPKVGAAVWPNVWPPVWHCLTFFPSDQNAMSDGGHMDTFSLMRFHWYSEAHIPTWGYMPCTFVATSAWMHSGGLSVV